MPLLIDCYNVLHTEKPPRLAGLTTGGLCRTLARSAWAGDRIMVVCDGRPAPGELPRSPVAGVALLYSGECGGGGAPGSAGASGTSGGDRTADEVIIAAIDADSAPQRLIVVSSDHEIQRAARRRRAVYLSSETFLHRLAQASPTAPNDPRSGADKPAPADQSRAEIDAWLHRFGYETSPSPAPPPQPSDLRPEDDPQIPWPPKDVERDEADG